MPKKYIFIQNGSSILDDISLQNVLHTLLRFFVFCLCSITASWAYKKPQNNKLDGFMKWVGPSKLLQN